MKHLHLFKTPLTQWQEIRLVTKDKSGVYLFINNVNGKIYVGSGTCLYTRLRDYYQDWYIIAKGDTAIVRAMLKYGKENFSIAILEYTDQSGAVPAEQRWIDLLKPQYNILKTAGSSLGYVHSAESRQKISAAMEGKPRSDVVRSAISIRQHGSDNTFFGKNHTDEAKTLIRAAALSRTVDPKPGSQVEVRDVVTNITTTYKSIRAVTKVFGCSITTVKKHNGLLFKGRYHISIKD